MTEAPLRVVKPNEKPSAKSRPKTIAEAAKSGTPRQLLEAMRDLVSETLLKPNCPPREIAALTKRLQDIVHDIEAFDARSGEDQGRRVRDLESALREVLPDHPLLGGDVDDSFDAAAL